MTSTLCLIVCLREFCSAHKAVYQKAAEQQVDGKGDCEGANDRRVLCCSSCFGDWQPHEGCKGVIGQGDSIDAACVAVRLILNVL